MIVLAQAGTEATCAPSKTFFRTVAPAILAFKYADRDHGGQWDRRRDYRDNGMNPIEMMLMDRAINGGVGIATRVCSTPMSITQTADVMV